MTNRTARYLAEYIEKNRLSAENISKKTGIPVEKLLPGTQEILSSEEFFLLCEYLYIDPKKIDRNLEI